MVEEEAVSGGGAHLLHLLPANTPQRSGVTLKLAAAPAQFTSFTLPQKHIFHSFCAELSDYFTYHLHPTLFFPCCVLVFSKSIYFYLFFDP